VKYVEWGVQRVLKPNKTYYWRVRGLYFLKNDLQPGVAPDPAKAFGHSETQGSFTIPPQSGSDSLANITQVTRDSSDTAYPTINKRYGMAYVARLPEVGSELRVAGATVKDGVPIYDTGREEFSKSVKGSWDMRPQWDVDGEGMFFDSNRSNNVFNIWYKRRDARGYTQLTFHNTDAWAPTINKSGNKVAYQVRNSENNAGWSIWVVDREGRSATELGAGEEPAFSPDGTKIAFVADYITDNVNEPFVAKLDGTDLHRLTNVTVTNADAEQVVWSADGSAVYCQGDLETNNETTLFRLDPTMTDQAAVKALAPVTGGDIINVLTRAQ